MSGLNIQIGGDTSGFQSALNDAVTEAKKFSSSGISPLISSITEAKKIEDSFTESIKANNLSLNDSIVSLKKLIGTGITPYSSSLQDATKTQKLFVDSFKAGNLGFKNAPADIDKFTKSILSGDYALTNVGRVLQDLPFGFIAIQNNLPPLIDSFGSLIKKSGGVSEAFKLIGSSLLSFGGLGLAFSAIISGLTLFSMASRKSSKDTEDLAEKQKSLTQILNDAKVSVAGQTAQVSGLSAILLDTNRSYQQRLAVLNELKKIGGDYFKGLTLEKTTYEDLKKASDSYTNSLIRQAQIKAVKDEITKLTEEIAKRVPDSVDKASKAFDQFQKSLTNKNSGAIIPTASLKDQINNFNKQLDSLGKKSGTDIGANIATNIAKGYESKAGEVDKIRTRLKEATDVLANLLEGTDTPVKSTGKNIRTVSDILSEMELNLKGVDTESKVLGGSIDNLNGDRIKIISSAFDELKTLLPPTSSELKSLASELERLGAAQIGEKTIGIRIQDSARSLRKTNLTKGLGLDIELINVNQNQEKLNSTIDKLKKDTEDKINKTTIEWKNISSGLGPAIIDIGNQFRGLATNIAGGLGEVIGSVITGGDSLGKSLYKLVGVMGSFLKDFGKSLIEAATLRIIAEKTLLTNPYVALAAGVAAIAVGTILQNKMPSFATGGAVFGPTTAMIGDNPGREEYVIPSEVLDKLGRRNGATNITGIIKGQDILLVTNRSARSNVRINGL